MNFRTLAPRFALPTLLAAVLALGLLESYAAEDSPKPLVSEDFDYPIGSALAGQSGGKGLGGSWTRGYNGNGDGEIVAALAFSDYPVSGHAVRLTATSPGDNNIVDIRAINAELGGAPQTVWTSCLYSYVVTPGSSPWFVSGVATQNDSWPDSVRGALLGTNGGSRFTTIYQDTTRAEAEATNNPSITYMLIGKFAGGASMTMWALTAADYDKIKAGGLTEEKLDATNSAKMITKYESSQETSLESYLSVFGSSSGTDSSLTVTIGQILMGLSLQDVLNKPAGSNKPAS